MRREKIDEGANRENRQLEHPAAERYHCDSKVFCVRIILGTLLKQNFERRKENKEMTESEKEQYPQ